MPSKPAQGSRPRPGGGFNQGFGNFSDEHLNESAMQNAMQQKQMTQQAAQTAGTPNPAQKATGKPMQQGAGQGAQPRPDRQLGTLGEELVKRPLADLWSEIKKFFDINTILGINPVTDTPEEQAKKKQLHQRYQQLDQDQQRVAQEEFQKRMQKKQQEEQEELQKKQAEEQRRKEQVVMPSKPKSGPQGPASGKSHKQNMMEKMQMDRKTMSQAQGAG